MTKFTYIIFAFLILCCVFLFAEWQCSEKANGKLKADMAYLTDSIKNSVAKVDTLWQYSQTKDTITVYQRTSRILVDTVYCAPRVYTGTYNSDMLAVRWRAQVFGQLDKIEILPSSSYRFPEITIQRTVILPQRNEVNVNNRERSHLYMSADLIGGVKIDGAGVGFTYLHRGGWGLSVGTMYANGLYWKAGLIFKLK